MSAARALAAVARRRVDHLSRRTEIVPTIACKLDFAPTAELMRRDEES